MIGVLDPGVIKLYHAPPQVDGELSTEVVEHYRVFPSPIIGDDFLRDVARNGIKNPIRIYTNGVRGVLRDGHHRLVVAKLLGLKKMPVHIIPDWLQHTYADYELPRLEPRLARWLRDNSDFIHRGHQAKRAQINKMVIQVFCSCGAYWRETPDECELG